MRHISALIIFLTFYSILTAQGISQIWGVTRNGGADNLGVVFSTDSNGSNPVTRHSFRYINKGNNPYSGHMTPFNGKLYGLIRHSFQSGVNIVFEYDPLTNEYKIKATQADAKGRFARTSLTEYDGHLYGVAIGGGLYNGGTLIKYDPGANAITTLVDMNNATGTGPNCDLTVFNNKIYGTTTGGGANGNGVLFEFDPSTSVYTVKYNFSVSDGRFGSSGMIAYNNKLYGLTGGGVFNYGILFEYDPVTNLYLKKYEFGRLAGANPLGSLLLYQDKLWGLASLGGENDLGVLFQYDPINDIYSKKFDFIGENGNSPQGDIVLVDNKFVGLTPEGGSNNTGTLFEYDPAANIYTKKIDLDINKGTLPFGSPVLLNNKLYGLTFTGGAEDGGVIFEYNPTSAVYTRKVNLLSTTGVNPYAGLSLFNNNLYGTTSFGGINGKGILFRYDLESHSLNTELAFDTASGYAAGAGLTAMNDKLYGTATLGGVNQQGVLFSYAPLTKTFSKLFEFDSVNGKNPQLSRLLNYDNKLFGTTPSGGAKNGGVLFQFDPANNTFTKKIDFDPAIGINPSGDAVVWNNKFYGLLGGGEGSIYSYDPANNTYVILYSFPGSYGPKSGLVVNNNKMYGVSYEGGSSNGGVLFEFDPVSGTFTKKADFNNATGIHSTMTLLAKNNLLYGMTADGGAFNRGTLFEFNPATNNLIKKLDFDSLHGAFPQYANLISIPAVVSAGVAGNCTALPSATISGATSHQWVAITDASGDAVAELNANGNDLGTVDASLYVQDNPARNGGGLYYLNRSLNISVLRQPAAGVPVSVRLYITKTELEDLISTPGSGITSINDLVIYKTENNCADGLGTDMVKLVTAASAWGGDYVLTTQVNSFSTFYFASANGALPVTITDFRAARTASAQTRLNWQTSVEINSAYFEVERSANGINFTMSGKVQAAGTSSLPRQYVFFDDVAASGTIYYRLKIVDADGTSKYSKVVKIVAAGTLPQISPNPAYSSITIEGAANFKQLQFINTEGRVVSSFVPGIGNSYDISRLKPGTYFVKLVNDKEVFIARFVKL